MGLIVPQAQIFTLQCGHAVLATVADATNYYFSNFFPITLQTTATAGLITIDKSCTIIAANFNSATGVAGSNEDWSLSVRVNNTTDNLIQTVASTSQTRRWFNTAMSVVLAAGDTINIKSSAVTWATNPTNLQINGYLTLRLN